MKYCEECSCEIIGEPVRIKYDLALEASDGYGDFEEVWLCKECAGLTKRAPDAGNVPPQKGVFD